MAETYTSASGPIEYVPDPAQPSCRLRLRRDANRGAFETLITTDGGKTWRTLFSDPLRAQAGSVATVAPGGSVVFVRPASVASAAAAASSSPASSAASAGTGLFSVDFQQVGTVYAGQTFGYYQAPANRNVVCAGLDLGVQTAALGGGISVCLVRVPANVETAQNAALLSGVEYGSASFATPLSMPVGSQWRARVKAVGATTAGENLSVRLRLSFVS